MITIREKQLLDLLEECLPLMYGGRNGEIGQDEITKAEYVLRLAGRKLPEYDEYGSVIKGSKR